MFTITFYKKNIQYFMLVLCVLLLSTHLLKAQVVVTSAGNVDMCVGGAYKTIPDFKVAEKVNTDFGASTSLQTYELSAPSNFEFNPGTGLITTPSSTDISFAYLNVTAAKITLSYFLNATAQKDSFIFKNIQVRAVGTNSSSPLQFTGGSAKNFQINNNYGQYSHANLNSANANVSLNVSSNSVCSNGSDINLNGSPGGGTYSGSSGISGSTFKPAIAGPGSYVITYTATNNGCTTSATATITVNAVPAVTFFGLTSSYCSADNDVPLTGFPSGGTFSGNGIVNTSFFRPSSAGVGSNKSVTYQYTANGCQGSATLQTTVKQSPGSVSVSLIPSKSIYFTEDDSIVVGGTQNINIPANGSVFVSGNGIVKGNDNIYRFFPKVVGAGTYKITRTVMSSSNNCTASIDTNITVNASAGGSISGLGETYCQTSGNVVMAVSNDQGAYTINYLNTTSIPGFGYYSLYTKVGVIDDSNINDGIATFKPSLADIGKYQIIFNGVNKGAIYGYVEIIESPTISVTLKSSYCSNDSEVNINYTSSLPGNVTFSGKGVNNGKFNPGNSGVLGKDTISYTYSQVSNGCSASGFVVTTVFQSPQNVGFSGIDNSYCSTQSYSTLNSNVTITPIGTGVFTSDGGGLQVDGSNNTIFNPGVLLSTQLNSKNYTIRYTYTTTDGCSDFSEKTTIVYKVPEVNLNDLNLAYCISKDTVTLSGSPGANSGTFSISAVAPVTAQSGMLYKNNKFLIGKTTPGTYYLTYTYKDPTTNCTSFDTDTTVINPLPLVTFGGLDTLYCVSQSDVQLVTLPAQGTFTSLSSIAFIDQNSKFQINKSGVGNYKIVYSYKDKNNCTNADTLKTIIYGKPTNSGRDQSLKLSTSCENDLIHFSDLSTTLDTSRGAKSFIKTVSWKIDTTQYSRLFKEDVSQRLVAGSHKVLYTLTTDKGCSSVFDSTVIIGSYPKTAFTWDKICNKENTKFYNTTSSNIVGSVNNIVWDFGDATPQVSIATSQTVKGDTSHTFATASNDLTSIYSVMLTASTNYNCITTDTQKVFILPAKDISSLSPYSNDFNDLVGDWVSSSAIDSIQSSWALGIPSKKNIKSLNGAWVTSVKKSFNQDETSYVYSPCFTIDKSITKPMIHMDIWSATNKNISGANLQYSSNGTNWNTLGKPNESGINWYNNETNISSRPSGTASLDQNGWTGTDITWKNVRHVFDNELGSSKNIRFRISFAGGIDTTDGFAFDNVWIGDRTRLILAEHFTNNSSAYTKIENAKLNDLVTTNLLNNQPKDIVSLQYHTAFPGPDQMNARNIPDAGARSLYYGITQIPYTCVDGSYFKGSALQIDTNMVNTRSLYDPAFNITLNPNLNSNNVSGSVTIENKIPVSNTVTVYISLLERFVNNIPGTNGETSYQWVHAKFLPDAAGTSFESNWSTQSSQTIDFNWDFTSANLYDPNKLAMIVFVQNNATKEIYQTAYKGLGATVATGVFNPAEKTSTVSLYPNPANDFTTVILNGKLSGEYNWTITDELGRTVDQGGLKNETDSFVINTQNYANGFYTLRLSNAADGVKTQKFVVVH